MKEITKTSRLIVTYSNQYGHAHTSASDELIEWILENNIPEIMLTRNEYSFSPIGGAGAKTPTGLTTTRTRGNSRRYVCPCCGTKVRATRIVNLICGDCHETMIES